MAGGKNAGLSKIILFLGAIITKEPAAARIARRDRWKNIRSDDRVNRSSNQQVIQKSIGIAGALDLFDANAFGASQLMRFKSTP